MTDQELLEQYMGLKVALSEYGFTENVVNAYIATSTEICMKYFDERGLVNLKAREKLRGQLEDNKKMCKNLLIRLAVKRSKGSILYTVLVQDKYSTLYRKGR